MIDPQRRQLLTLLATLPGVLVLNRAEGAVADSPRAIFDYFLGDWQVRHRRLAQRLVGSTEWEEYEGSTHCQAILGGIANYNDSIVHRSGATYRSLGLRAFDPNTKVWTDWSLDGRNPTQVTGRRSRPIRQPHRHLLRRRHLQRQADPRARHLHTAHGGVGAVGAGVFGRRRPHLGDELRDATTRASDQGATMHPGRRRGCRHGNHRPLG
jgi:hypothetical protein